jgi:hypothetical protein
MVYILIKIKFDIDINNDQLLKTIWKHKTKIKQLIVTSSAQQRRPQIKLDTRMELSCQVCICELIMCNTDSIVFGISISKFQRWVGNTRQLLICAQYQWKKSTIPNTMIPTPNILVHTIPISYQLVPLHIPLPTGRKNAWDLWYKDESGIKNRYTNTTLVNKTWQLNFITHRYLN